MREIAVFLNVDPSSARKAAEAETVRPEQFAFNAQVTLKCHFFFCFSMLLATSDNSAKHFHPPFLSPQNSFQINEEQMIPRVPSLCPLFHFLPGLWVSEGVWRLEAAAAHAQRHARSSWRLLRGALASQIQRGRHPSLSLSLQITNSLTHSFTHSHTHMAFCFNFFQEFIHVLSGPGSRAEFLCIAIKDQSKARVILCGIIETS